MSKRSIAVVLTFLLMSTIPSVAADDGENETLQAGEVDFFLTNSDIDFSPSDLVNLNNVVGIQATVTREGDEYSAIWTKEGVNIPLGGGGGDDTHMISPRVLLENGTYKMWYGGSTGTSNRIYYATSPDGSSWTKLGVVLDIGPAGSLDDTHVTFHWVMKEGSTYKMWYSGADYAVTSGGKYRIFYADSPDGVTWSKKGVVLDVGPGGSADSTFARSPTIINESGTYKMWYSGRDNADVDRILHATSPNGINWTKLGVVLDVGQPGDYDDAGSAFPYVWNTPCGYAMLYGGWDSSQMRILHATSTNGLDWEREGLVLDVGPSPQEDPRVGDQYILFNGTIPERMWYSARGTNYQIFSASPDVTGLSSMVSVNFYVDAVDPADLIANVPDVQFPFCGCKNVFANWTASTLGIHEVFVVVDPDDTVQESNELNNVASQSLLVLDRSVQADAGPDHLVNEGDPVQMMGSGSAGPPTFMQWLDSFENTTYITQLANASVENGSVVLNKASIVINHTFDSDPGFIIEDDQPNTVLWWDSGTGRIRWYVDREDPRDHYEKLVRFLPHPITDAWDIRASVDYLYWRADSYSVAVPIFLQRNESWRLGNKRGPANNTLWAYVYGGDLMMGNVDRLPGILYDNTNATHIIYKRDYDNHFWELFTTRISWDSDTRTMYGEVTDPSHTIVVNGSTIVNEPFTFSKYGVGSNSDGYIDPDPHLGEGFADNMSISAFGYRTPGSAISTQIDSGGNLSHWISFNMSTIEPSGTGITVDIMNETGEPLMEGIEADDCPLSLFDKIDPIANRILILRANLMTRRNETPALLEWSLNYTTSSSVEYTWDVNHLVDGNGDSNFTNDIDFTGRSIEVTYGDNGVYEVHLTIRDSGGNSSVDSCNVTVLNTNPTVSYTLPSSPVEGAPVVFNASAIDPGSDDLTFLWDWDDGSNESWTYYNDGMGPDPPNSPDVNPINIVDQWAHTYGHGGPYTVNLTVVDDDGGSTTVLFLLDVSNVGPTVVLDITDPNPVVEGSPALLGGYFDDPSWLDNHTVMWDFGDGQSMPGSYMPGIGFTHHNVQNVTHTYGDDGVFQVTLNVTDEYGADDEATVAITAVNEAPSANISCPAKVSLGVAFQCSSGATDPGSDDLLFDWDWDDGSPHNSTVHYNNGVSPDPYPSPGPVYPFSANETAVHSYSLIGNYTIILNVSDDDGGSIQLQADIEVVGPPETILVIGNPKYVSVDTYITSSTPLSFSVWDRSGMGIVSTYYNVDGGAWTEYVSPFFIPDEGLHVIYFNSTDVLGGAEETKNQSLIVDNTPPTSSLIVGAPNYTAVDLWISPTTPLTLLSSDASCGLSHIEYDLDGGGWQNYTIPITVPIEGSHTLLYRGVDNLGNMESPGSLAFWVDGTPPSSTVNVGTPNYTAVDLWIAPSTTLEVVSVDDGSGLAALEYRLDGGIWQNYTAPITVPAEGLHSLEYRGIDNLGFAEAVRTLNFRVDGTPPVSDLSVGSPNYTGIDLWISPSTLLTITTTDAGSGVSYAEYDLDGTGWQTYSTPFTVLQEGAHSLEYRGVDNLGHTETPLTLTFWVDGSPPTSDVVVGSPNYTGMDLWIAPSTPLTIGSNDAGCGLLTTEYQLDGGGWQTYAAPLTVSTEGAHILLFRGIDNLGNTEVPGSLAFRVDATPPTSHTTVGTPNYTAVDLWISPSTEIEILSTDAGSGVSHIEYQLDGGMWQTYAGPITVPQEGTHFLVYQGTDNLGFAESPGSLIFIVDGTPPTSMIDVGIPKYQSADLWISPSTPLTLSSADTGCGLAYIEYRMDGGPWQTYSVPLTVMQEGSHTLTYRGVDNLGTIETELTLDFIVDGSPPSSVAGVGSPNYTAVDLWISPLTEIDIQADDAGSGIQEIEFSIDGGGWQVYYSPITVSQEGSHTLSYRAMDNIGNVEETLTLDFVVDATPPSSEIAVGVPNYTSLNLWISPSTPLSLSSMDGGCGLSRIEFRLDQGTWQDYVTAITVLQDGSHTLGYRGIDHLGNVEAELTFAFIVDGTPPVSTIEIGEPKRDVDPVEVYEETLFDLSAADNGSGVAFIQFRIDGAAWRNYTASFDLTGYETGFHTIEFRAYDNLANQELTQSTTILLIEPAAEDNLKPLIAILFALILAVLGALLAVKRPFVSEGGKRRGFTFLSIALPFVVIELVTGILSLFMPSIAVPPWFGLGMIIDLVILIAGVVVEVIVFARNRPVESAEIGTEEDEPSSESDSDL